MKRLTVLALGGGIQSTTLLLMSCRGILPKLDAAVFADTQWESAATYEHLDWLEGQAAAAGIPVFRTTAGSLREHTMNQMVAATRDVPEGKRYASLPVFVVPPGQDRPGRLKRQCSKEYKFEPCRKLIRERLLGLRPRKVAPANAVEQWIGYSWDERRRIRGSREHWRGNAFPLCNIPDDYLPGPYTRLMCQDWLWENFPSRIVPRSSCLGCPNHTNAEWAAIKKRPDEWAATVEVDRAIRHQDKLKGLVYLHRDGPLEEVDLRSDRDRGQAVFDYINECTGYCGT